MRRYLPMLAVCLAAAASNPLHVLAWGDDGHVAVCEIAFLELDAATQQKVSDILQADPDFKTFPAACTWPDMNKGKPHTIQNQRRSEHFVNVSRSLPAITAPNCGAVSTCLFTAIDEDSKALKPHSGKDRLQALKFLGHWVGDLHQPLHISFADDAGGNEIVVKGIAKCGELHGVWDECIPADLMQQNTVSNGVDLGIKLHAAITNTQRAAWQQGSLVDWAEESYGFTLAQDTQYCAMNAKKKQCCYSKKACTHDGEPKRSLTLTGAYDDQHTNVVNERLQRAGVRLAKILSETLQ